jgi:hypothetical protein
MIAEEDVVRLTQLYGRFASVKSKYGHHWFEGKPSWSETDLVQAIARWPGGLAWYTVDGEAMHEKVRERSVGDMVSLAREAGAPVRIEGRRISVLVRAAVTQTLGGVRVDEDTRAADGLFVAGADAGGISTGGWSSGLAAALVLGLVAAESALA